MINAAMRKWDFYLYESVNAYGQAQLSADVKGSVKMSIVESSRSVQDNILYSGAEYVGLTMEPVTDKYVIKYGSERLKVLHVTAAGRYKQVYLARM